MMESSVEKMEVSEIKSPTKSETEPSSQVETNGKESSPETQPSPQVESSQVEQTSQEISSPAAPSSSAAVSSQAAPSSSVVSSQLKLTQAASLSLPSTSAEALLSSVSSDMENGHAQKKQCLDYNSMSTGVYLDSTVVPILHVALVTLDRLRPADPVQFVIDFLLRNKAQYSKKIQSVKSTNQA